MGVRGKELWPTPLYFLASQSRQGPMQERYRLCPAWHVTLFGRPSW